MIRLVTEYALDKRICLENTIETNEKIKELLDTNKYKIEYKLDRDRDTICAKIFVEDKIIGDQFDVIKLDEYKNSFNGIKQSKAYILDDEKIFLDVNIDALVSYFVNKFLNDIDNDEYVVTNPLSLLIARNVKTFDEKNELEDWCVERLWKILDKRHTVGHKIIKLCSKLVKDELEKNKTLTKALIINYLSNGNCESDGLESIHHMYIRLIDELIPAIFEETKKDDKWYKNLNVDVRKAVKLF